MGGTSSPYFAEFVRLCKKAFLLARKHSHAVTRLMEIMAYCGSYPSFLYNPNAISDFRNRLRLDLDQAQAELHVENLVKLSLKHRGTDLYDQFQLATNGIKI